LKQQIGLCAAAVILGFTPSGPLLAQSMPAPYPGYTGPGYPGALGGGLPPYEIVAIVRSRGLEPLSRPVRQGPAYVLRAADPSGRLMLVFVDARMGRIVRVAPTMRPDAIGAPPYPIPPGRMVPDGNSPNSRIAGFPNAPDELTPDERGPVPPGAPGFPAAAPGRPSAKATPPPLSPPFSPPLPRPRPKVTSSAPAADSAPAANPVPSTPAAAPASPPPAPALAPSASADQATPLVEMDE
jgi:hypothetical protein